MHPQAHKYRGPVVPPHRRAATDEGLRRFTSNQQLLGSGAFGRVYEGVDKVTGKPVAIKVEPADECHPQLIYEAKWYHMLQVRGFPRVYYFSDLPGRPRILIMQRLGPSLEDLLRKRGRFSLQTTCMLADQMITRMQQMHSVGLIHRDIKPDNFLVETEEPGAVLNLIDLGMAKRFVDKSGRHIKYRDDKSICGTPRYISVNMHNGLEQSRRDDMESLGYVIMYMYLGRLPWQGLQRSRASTSEDWEDKYYRLMLEYKNSTVPLQLCKGCPSAFRKYFEHVMNLGFTHKPDYNYLRRLFRSVAERHEFEYDGVYDWCHP